MVAQHQWPFSEHVRITSARVVGEVVPVGIRAAAVGVQVRLVKGLTIAVHHSVLQPNAVSGHTYDPLDHVESLLRRVDKNYDFPVPNLAVRHQGTDVGSLQGRAQPVYE